MKKIIFIVLIIACSACIGSKKTIAPAIQTVTVANPAFAKLFCTSGDGWYKIATLKSKGYIGKHTCSFKIYSGDTPHRGIYYASYYLNLRRGMGDRYYGTFYCIDWNKNTRSRFLPDDVCVTYDGEYTDEVTTTIWKQNSSGEDSWVFTADMAGFYLYGGANCIQLAENSYRGVKESIPQKPSVADGYDFVIDPQFEPLTKQPLINGHNSEYE
ncbi:MAG: hypothetical protein LBR81_01880 [Prevotellaceae bacterium]|jgi:hypothetical protein|nr:hypothetical protein [Prevotellaceae bacterium]